MVEVFKTNVSTVRQVERMIKILQLYFSDCHINFDLEDRDRILRIEGNRENFDLTSNVLLQEGYLCEKL